jgi:hypothetical protein
VDSNGPDAATIGVVIEPPANGPDDGGTPVLWHGGRGRRALVVGAARFAAMASISAALAWRGLAEAQPGTPLYSPLFDLVVPLVFTAMALWLAARALNTTIHFAYGEAPVLSLTPTGLLAPAIVANVIPWTAVAEARVFRGRYSARLLIDLVPGSNVRTRLWPFWSATTLSLWVADPNAACAAILTNPNYRDPQFAAN